MSDTPECDESLAQLKLSGYGGLVHLDVARRLERQRDAYAETLREIDKSGMVGNVIHNRHPELAEEKP